MKKIKLLALAVVAVALNTGCTFTDIGTTADGGWNLNRKSIFQRVEIPEVSITTNGVVSMKGYKNDGGNEALVNALVAMTQLLGTMKAASGVPTP